MALEISMMLNGIFFGVMGVILSIICVKTVRDVIQVSIEILNRKDDDDEEES